MEVQFTAFKDLIICKPKVFEDDRGYFYESFNLKNFTKVTGLSPVFVQDNQSRSTFGVLRGLHFQVGDMAQSKLVRVLEGEVLDVVVDMRKEEPTFGKSFSIMLTAANRTQLYIPRGFAHGFLTLSSTATFCYKCDNYYDETSERGLLYNDPALDINWQLEEQDFILSQKDKESLRFEALIKTL
ncbi:MAG: dTDP-4-dehydrorhamnose 3,5-epimerase [Dokdonia sp.]|jgi:dTDP-4-dehydrorhamnose 3,5-epimerase|nr:dTDP-4-dehydrorhamnose 3,5-epimerase [Dokdonia sp.]